MSDNVDALFEIVEGWTNVIGPFTITKDGLPLDLSGFTVTLVLHRGSGAAVVAGGVVTLLNQTTYPGQLTYKPVAADFTWESNLYTTAQSYLLHWKVVDGSANVAFAPHGEPKVVIVHRA